MSNFTYFLKKYSLFVCCLVFLKQQVYTQNCNAGVTITPNKANYCAGEPITVKINNPSANFSYRMIINGIIYDGTEVTLTFPGADISTIYDINVQFKNSFGNFASCQPIVALRPKITVSPSPDPALSERNGFKLCNAATQAQEFAFFNNSNTKNNNTKYHIDWGDATTPYDSPTFDDTVKHSYNPGQYTLTYTVTGDATFSTCNPSSKTYTVSVGRSPKMSPNFSNVPQCAPGNYPFSINLDSIINNLPDTKYQIFVSNKQVQDYTQTTIVNNTNLNVFFDKGSCDETCFDGIKNTKQYSVVIRATNECGTTTAATCVPVKDTLDPFIAGPDTVCVGVQSTYSDGNNKDKELVIDGTCEQAIKRWTLSPGTGYTSPNTSKNLNTNSISFRDNLIVTFTEKGTYQLKLLVGTNDQNLYCKPEDTTMTIVVVDKPNASFVLDQNKICSGNTVKTTNTSVNEPGVKYKWTIAPATGWVLTSGTLDSTNIEIKFNNKANYNISLKAYISKCEEEVSQIVSVVGVPNVDTNTIPVICTLPYTFNNTRGTVTTADDYFMFDNGNDNAATYTWAFQSGTPATANTINPGNVLFNTIGTYGIFAQVTNQCGIDSITLPISLFNFPKPDAGANFSACVDGTPMQLTGFSPTGGVWSGPGITDPINGIFNPANAGGSGIKTLVYTVNQASVCPTFDTTQVNIIQIAGLSAGLNQEICKGTGTLQLSGESIAGGNWFGLGAASMKVSSSGEFNPTGMIPTTYQVGYTVQDASGTCRDTAYKNVLVKDSIHFKPPTDLCVGQAYNFGQISDNIKSPTTWNFGDGSPPSFLVGPNVPIHTYATTGVKNVTLNATTLDGCAETLVFPINVKLNPQVSFNVGPTSNCNNVVQISFPNTHVELANQYVWYYNNQSQVRTDTSSFSINLPLPVLADSVYTITLVAQYTCGNPTAQKSVTIGSKPVADFSISTGGCTPFNPTIVNNAYGSPATYFWNFGIVGQTSTLPNPTAPVYFNPHSTDTTYTITQTVSNACGTNTASKNITVKPSTTIANIAPHITEGCQPLNVQFESVSSVGSVQWSFGDGTIGFSQFEPKIYDTVGNFLVRLVVIGNCGSDTALSSVTIHPKPILDFSFSNLCLGKPTLFTSTTSNAVSTTWSFGDIPLTYSSLPNPTKTYNSTGSYDVWLRASSNKGCKDSISKVVTINDQPTANFTILKPKVCLGEQITFINTSLSGGSPIYTWTFGDGNTSVGSSPGPYIYKNSGTYTVSLEAKDGVCVSTKTVPNAVTIFNNPTADFDFTIDPNEKFKAPVLYNNLSTFGFKYLWAFRAGDSSTQKDPMFLYGGIGPYKTTLFVETENGCKDDTTKILAVNFDGALYLPNAFAPELGDGTNESSVFKPKGVDLKEYHVQIFSTYGQLIWESTALQDGSPTEAWDGKYKGEILPQDVYIWKVRAIFKSGKAWEGVLDQSTGRKTTMGSVLLIR